jgi:DNA-directed RNA polymerase sigma subunit (sigma70/sigma32)
MSLPRPLEQYSNLGRTPRDPDYDPLDDPRQEQLNQQRAFHTLTETDEGRRHIVTQLTKRAATLDAESIAELGILASEGEEAVRRLIHHNVLLCLYTAHNMLKHLGGAGSFLGHVTAAYDGLRFAVNSFDDMLNFRFSTYATKTMQGYILNEVNQALAAERGMTVAQWRRVQLIRDAELELTVASIHPTDEEVTKKTGFSAETLAYYRKLAAKGDAMLHTKSLSASAVIDGERTIEEVAGAREYFQEQTDAEVNDGLRDALEAVFKAVGLPPEHATVLRAMFGVPPYASPLTESELAVQLNVPKKQIQTLFAAAKSKLKASPQALDILASFLSK